MDEIQPESTHRSQDEEQPAEPVMQAPAMAPPTYSQPPAGAPLQAQNQEEEDDPSAQENMRKRQEQALMFEKYLEESGLCLSFQIIFTEIIQKQIPED